MLSNWENINIGVISAGKFNGIFDPPLILTRVSISQATPTVNSDFENLLSAEKQGGEDKTSDILLLGITLRAVAV